MDQFEYVMALVSVVVGLVADSFMAGVQVAVTVILLASFAGIVSGHWPTKS